MYPGQIKVQTGLVNLLSAQVCLRAATPGDFRCVVGHKQGLELCYFHTARGDVRDVGEEVTRHFREDSRVCFVTTLIFCMHGIDGGKSCETLAG